MFAVGSVNAAFGQENRVLCKARAAVAVLPGAVAVPQTVGSTAAALGTNGYGLLNAGITSSLTLEKLLQSL